MWVVNKETHTFSDGNILFYFTPQLFQVFLPIRDHSSSGSSNYPLWESLSLHIATFFTWSYISLFTYIYLSSTLPHISIHTSVFTWIHIFLLHTFLFYISFLYSVILLSPHSAFFIHSPHTLHIVTYLHISTCISLSVHTPHSCPAQLSSQQLST